ncbi:MAG: prolyl oligopeptidase family serine peptidase [Candidatus Binatia bacterium]
MKRHRSLVAPFVAAALVAACGGSSGGGRQQDALSRSGKTSSCSDQSWIGGTTELCNGFLVYRDYVYDDHGADTNPLYNSPIGDLSPVAGDAEYPAGAENTADLVTLTLFIDDDDLVVSFELNTLFEPDSTIAAIAIDTDDNPQTGGGEWTGLGVRSDGWEVLHEFETGNPDTNIISGRFPMPGGDSWRVQAVVAQANGTVMNVAFRGTEEEAKGLTSGGLSLGTWWEDKQAAALAAGDISSFGAVVDVDDLEDGVTRHDPINPGLHERVYKSKYTLGEGIDVDGVPGRHGDTGTTCEQYFHFLGKYQPYGIYIPDREDPRGVQFVLHGCNANHASLINNTGMQQRFGEDQNRILIVPLGRGPVGFNSDISERDVLDAFQDVVDNYVVDQEQVFSGGYSMGGYGTLRFAELYPDLFAGAVNWVGFTGSVFNLPIVGANDEGTSGAIGNVIEFVGNMRHVPIANMYAAEDELVHVTTALAMMDAFRSADGVPYEFFLHPVAEHLTFAILDEWVKEAAYSAGRRRVAKPARITYRTDESLEYPEYEIKHDRAYWISEIRGRGAGFVDTDITSFGCGGAVPVYTTGNRSGTGPGPLVWISEFRELAGSEQLEQANRLEGVLTNVASLEIDVGGACLAGAAVEYDLMTDGSTTVRLSDGRALTLSGAGPHHGSL